MPLITINCIEGTFSSQEKQKLAASLTTTALRIESLPNSSSVRRTCWIFINEMPVHNVFRGGEETSAAIVSMDVNVFKGGLGTSEKGELISEFTQIIHDAMHLPADIETPLYILIRETDEDNWGVFGTRITLEDLRKAK
jgi:phenylpyruvate tautomerase PptA (4-oxalocrotonate tautomerase family)